MLLKTKQSIKFLYSNIQKPLKNIDKLEVLEEKLLKPKFRLKFHFFRLNFWTFYKF